MKKNAMLKIAAILMVAVLLTTCAISSTFAKYVTAPGAANSTARVAKWGVQVTATAASAFATEYKNGTEVTVESQAEMKVMAPGTGAEDAVSVTVAGQPEVDAEVTVAEGDFVTLGGNWTIVDGETTVTNYCPIKFTVVAGKAGTAEKVFMVGGKDHNNADITNGDELITAVNAYITSAFKGGTYQAEGTDEIDMVLNIDWEWVFEGDTGAEAYRTNTRDTLLGNKVDLANEADAPSITFNAQVSVTQKD